MYITPKDPSLARIPPRTKRPAKQSENGPSFADTVETLLDTVAIESTGDKQQEREQPQQKPKPKPRRDEAEQPKMTALNLTA